MELVTDLLPESTILEPSSLPCVELSSQEAFAGDKTIRTLYREGLKDKQRKRRNLPREYPFTPDISIWYTFSQSEQMRFPKVEAYVCHLPTAQQRKHTRQARGARVKGAYKSVSTLPLSDIPNWLEIVAAYVSEIHDGVVMAFDKAKGIVSWRDLALKSYWYLKLDITKLEDNLDFEMERELFCSPVGLLPLRVNEDTLQEEMRPFLEGRTKAEQQRFWELLSPLFDQAVRERIISENCAKELSSKARSRNPEYSEVRHALAKRNFSREEELTLLRMLREQLPGSGRHLGVLIRFFTGLSPNIICALTWGDIRRLPDGSRQFWIQRQVTNGRKEIRGFENAEVYRRLPVSGLLWQGILARREHLKQTLKITDSALSKFPLLVEDEAIAGKEDAARVSPKALARTTGDVIRAMGIPDYEIELPDQNGGKETNLNRYGGDLLRAHVHYCLGKVCGFTVAEKDYFFGKQQSMTFAKHYCDFRHDAAQLLMLQKLQRWDASLMQDQEKNVSMEQMIEKLEYITAGPLAGRTSVELDLSIRSAEDLKITMECPGGFSSTVLIRRK